MTTYQWRRNDFVLELSMDDDNKCFTLTCHPPGAFENADAQKEAKKFCAHVARGFAQRHRIGYNATIKIIEGRQVGIVRGKIFPA